MKALSFTSNYFQNQGMLTEATLRSFPLFLTKLAIPSVYPPTVARPALVTELTKGRKFKITLISAPTGFGKTTLLSEWAHESLQPVAWVSLNESNNDPVQFWSYLAVALAGVSEHTATRLPKLFALEHQEAILTEIMRIIDAISQDVVLVLDDYHTIHNPVIHEVLISFLEYLPAHVHIFIASRTRPPLQLPRLRARGQLHELRPADLLFTLEEVAVFLARTLGQEPSPGQLKAIKAQTEGWVAILNLTVIWLQRQKDGWEALDRLAGTHHYVQEYLLEEVLQRQSQEVQVFLLQTSILTRFNKSLCDALTESKDSHLLLEQVGQANLQLTTSKEQQDWHSYYVVLRTFLRERLTQIFPEQVLLLHRRAYIWYEKQGMYAEAITHALAMQDFEKSTEIVRRYGENMLASGEVNSFLTWLKKFSTCINVKHGTGNKEQIGQPLEDTAQARFISYVHSLLEEFARKADEVIVPHEQTFCHSERAGIFHDLNERELAILRAITTGLSNHEIAQKMIIADSTVKWYVKNIYSKLQVHNRAQTIIKAQKLRLV